MAGSVTARFLWRICHDEENVGVYSEILRHAQTGTLTADELEGVLSKFRSGIGHHAGKAELVMILGEATVTDPTRARTALLSSREARAYLEPLLDATDDPWLVRNTLDVLCNYLGDSGRIRDRLYSLVRPSDWDPDGDARIVAITALGKLIAREGTPEGLTELLAIAESPLDPLQDWAVRGLALALGATPLSLPSARKRMRSDPALVERTLQRAREWRDSAP